MNMHSIANLLPADPLPGARIREEFDLASCRPVVTGIGIVTPMADNLGTLCDLVETGRNGFSKIARFDTSWCDTDLACSYPAESDRGSATFRRKWMDRAAWYILDALAKALDDAGIDLGKYDPERIAVVLGTSHSGLVTSEELFAADLVGELALNDPRRILAIPASHVSSVVATAVGAKGVRRTVSSACASSTGAMGIAADLIAAGEADLVITGGSDTVSLAVMAGFNSLKALAPDGCQPFSVTPGITLGEGAGVFLLERLDQAHARSAAIRAEIVGYALSGDAHHATAPDENGDGIRRVLEAALADAAIDVGQVDYLSAHGTGTEANDIAESCATAGVFGTSVPVSTAKPIFGHTLGASGVIETALTIGMAERDKLTPTLGFAGLRPSCTALDYIPNDVRTAKTDVFVCNNYGFGGSNASVVFRRVPAVAARGIAHRAPLDRVVVSGVGVVNSLDATGPAGLLDILTRGEDPRQAICSVPSPRVPPHLRRQIGRTSPMVKYAVGATGDALEVANVSGELNAETGLIFSTITGAQSSIEKYMESVFVHGPAQASAHHFQHTTNNAGAGQISICFGLKGYNTTLCGASGTLGYAISLVANGRQSRVVAVGGDEYTPLIGRFCAHAGIITDERVSAFDRQPGINYAEGAASIVFESHAQALQRGHRPLADVLGFMEAQDGTYTGVNRRGEALRRCITGALTRAGLLPSDVDMIVANGTGPGRFALAEENALAEVFGMELPRTVSLASAIGCGPAHMPIATAAAAAALVSASELPPALGAVAPRVVLAIAIDITGVSSVTVLGRMEDTP